MAALRTLVAEHEVERVVIGLPRLMDGRLDAAAAAAQEFGTQLARATGRPVEYWDERLTTVAAERYLVAQGKRRRQRRAEVDRMAAALLLQSYLDYREVGVRRLTMIEEPEADGELETIELVNEITGEEETYLVHDVAEIEGQTYYVLQAEADADRVLVLRREGSPWSPWTRTSTSG